MSLRTKIIVFLVLHSVGIIGFTIDSFQSIFIQLIPIHLLLISIVLCLDKQLLSLKFILFFILSFSIGYCAEVIGVKSHYLFGYYEYSNVLGIKLFEVPLIIGILWFSTAYAANNICLILFSDYKWISIPASALLMMAFDFLVEPFAVRFGMWTWRDGVIPEYNFQSWFLVGLLISFIYQKFLHEAINFAASYFLIFQMWFFLTLRYTLILF
jgi:putative membrane protein